MAKDKAIKAERANILWGSLEMEDRRDQGNKEKQVVEQGVLPPEGDMLVCLPQGGLPGPPGVAPFCTGKCVKLNTLRFVALG